MIEGCIHIIYKKCGSKTCHCKDGQKHGPYSAIVRKVNGKSKLTCVDKLDIIDKAKAYKKYNKRLANLRKINEEIFSYLRYLRDINTIMYEKFFEKITNNGYEETMINASLVSRITSFKIWNIDGGIKGMISIPMLLLKDSLKLNSSSERVFSIFWIITLLIIPITILLALFLKRAIFKTDTFKFFVIAFVGYIFLYILWSNSMIILRFFVVGFPYLFLLSAMTLKMLIELIGNKILNKLKIVFPILLLCFYIIIYVNFHLINNLFRKNASKIFHKLTVDEIISSEFTYKEDNENITNFGKGIIELKSMVKEGDKILSFIPGVYYMGENAISIYRLWRGFT